MPFWDLTLTKKVELGNQVTAFYFNRPKGFAFKAGQYGGILFDVPDDGHIEDYFKSFTIASSPYEKQLMLVTRIRDSDFKRQLNEINIGQSVCWDAPYGNFLLTDRPAVFIANGLGITPAHSMIRQAIHDSGTQPLQLIYLNKAVAEQVLVSIFEELASEFPHLQFQSELRPEGWFGLDGAKALQSVLADSITDFSQSIFYVSGSYPLVQATKKALLSLNVDPLQIKLDEFTGY